MRYSLLLLSLVLTACGGESTTSVSGDSSSNSAALSLDGTWEFSSMQCDGQFTSISQYEATITISNGTGTIVNSGYDTEDCEATESFRFTTDADYAYVTSEQYSCAPTSCDFQFNKDSLPIRYNCDLSWPFAYGTWAYRVDGNDLYISTDGICVSKYTK